jgi:methionyl-tRNA formyltransferase
MKIVFLGCTKFSETLLRAIKEIETVEIAAIFGIPKEFNISYSKNKVRNVNYFDFSKVAEDWVIPYYEIDSAEKSRIGDYSEVIRKISPDVILVLGWYYMVPKKIRDLAKFGAWGIHASLLPKYAGGAPLVWAIINGEDRAGVSLFRLDDGVDDGDIIKQKAFPIKRSDTIKSVYKKATDSSVEILTETLKNMDKVVFTKQDKTKIDIYPQRKPEDGEIDLSSSSEKLYDFIRAQSSPYPGAFIRTIDGKKLVIEKARIDED